MPLSPSTQKFVLHWGEMGSRWGGRTVAHQDIWEIFRVVMDERKKRELDPSTRAKMDGMLEFMELFMGVYYDFKRLLTPTLKRLLETGSKIAHFLGPDKDAKP